MGDGLACDFLSQLLMGAMSRVIRLSAMAAGFSAASADRRNGTGLKISEFGEFLQETATAVEQFGQRFGHEQLQAMI